jgi:4-hydroxybenzoate polyprenyltransferase
VSDPDIDSASRPGHGPGDPAELQQGGTAAAVPASARGPQPLHGAAAIRAIAADIKLGHSIFALPFALLGAFLAAVAAGGPLAASAAGGDGDGRFRFAMQLALVIVAMVAARTAAMIANRLVDRAIDARNPRTAGRALPSGRVAAGTMWVAMLASIAATLAAAAAFRLVDGNPWPLYLAVPVLAWLLLYGYLKRFTWLCHLWLGISLGMSPVLAAVAVNPQALEGLAPWLLGAAVTCWVAGFDVIYALQDVEIDRREGLSSLPASWGEGRALHASRLLHIAATALLVGVYLVAPGGSLGRLYVGGVAIAGLVLLVEHLTVKRWGTSRLAITFGLLNGVVSIVVGGAGIADLLIS